MKKMFSILVSVCVLLAGANFVLAQPGDTDSFIVQVKQGADPSSVAGGHGIVPRFIYKNAANGFSGRIAPGLLKKLESDPNVLSVVPDRVVTANVKPAKPVAPAVQTVPAGVKRIGAEPGALSYTGAGVGVAIVDTGIDLLHKDLSVSADCFYAYSGSCQDDNGHGTHVGGIVAALNNTHDTVGVAPNATLYSVKVLNSAGSGYDSDIIAGLDWVAANAVTLTPPIKVVNMSLGRAGTADDNPAMQAAIQNLVGAGISVVVSAGNDQNLEISQNVPAAYPEVMAIASTTAQNGTGPTKGTCKGIVIPQDTASYFTTDGAGVTVSAPGETREDVKVTCSITSQGILSLALGGGTTNMSGTSMSSPHVAGVAALLYEKSSGITPQNIKDAIKAGASMQGAAPLDSPTSSYSFDGTREGILSAPGALYYINF